MNHFSRIRRVFGCTASLGFLLISIPTFAQNGLSGRDPALAGLAPDREVLVGESAELQARESRIGPDDVLDITVFEAQEMNRTVRVSTSGEISFPLIGAVKAAGLTSAQLEAVLQEQLRKSYMRDPHVGVFVRDLQSHPVSILGAVKKPGVFQIQGTKTLLEVLSMAEGPADDAGDAVLIMRGAGLAQPVSYQSLQHRIPANSSTALLPVVSTNSVTVPMPEEANSDTELIHLKSLLDSSDPALNVAVRPGDIVKIPRAGIVYVVGEVHKPGGFVLQNNENISVLQALALAEGLTHTSAKKEARIIRTESTTGKRTEIPLNLAKILGGKLPDPPLQPKDIVFIPNSLGRSALIRGSEAALVAATGAAVYRTW